MALTKFAKMSRFVPSLYKPETNPFIRGLLVTFADEDDKIVAAQADAKEQLFVATAKQHFLDALGSNVGVFRPVDFNLPDDLFRQLIPALSFAPKQVLPTILRVLRIFFGNNPVVQVHEIRPNQIEIQIPSSVPSLRRTLKGSHHFHDYAGSILWINNVLKEIVVSTPKNLYMDELAGAKFGVHMKANTILSNGVQTPLIIPSPSPDVLDLPMDNFTHYFSPGQYTAVASAGSQVQTGLNILTSAYPNGTTFLVCNPIIGKNILLNGADPGGGFIQSLVGGNNYVITIYDNTLPNGMTVSSSAVSQITFQFDAGDDLTGYVAGERFNIARPGYQGSFMPDPRKAFTVTDQRGILGQTITAGSIVPTCLMTEASGIPNGLGKLVFNLGRSNEESLVKYFGRPNNTTLFLDPIYAFTKDHAIGEPVNLVVTPYQKPDPTGIDYSAYIVGVTAARILAQNIVESIVAAGVVINWNVIGPVIDC